MNYDIDSTGKESDLEFLSPKGFGGTSATALRGVKASWSTAASRGSTSRCIARIDRCGIVVVGCRSGE